MRCLGIPRSRQFSFVSSGKSRRKAFGALGLTLDADRALMRLELRNVVANYLFEGPPDLREYSGILAIRVMRRCTASRLDYAQPRSRIEPLHRAATR